MGIICGAERFTIASNYGILSHAYDKSAFEGSTLVVGHRQVNNVPLGTLPFGRCPVRARLPRHSPQQLYLSSGGLRSFVGVLCSLVGGCLPMSFPLLR